ncbi:MAG: molybdopterin-dependent oxidoreductase [Dehalococcoidia bacterium]|nr:molybdopterin-dependent oxidoreductase [Dehalococcoidia bacterium]
MTTIQQPPKLIGEPIKRREDPRLITGQATYVDDIRLHGMLYMSLVRSPYGHAHVTNIDTSAAAQAEGVVAILTAREVKAMSEPMPVAAQLEGMNLPVRWALASDVVRYQGEPVAAVIADDRYRARDAADLVLVDYEELPAVVDPDKALEPGADLIHSDFGTNAAITIPIGSTEDTDRAFAEADVVIKQRMINQRLIPVAMEPRGVVAQYNAGEETMTVWSSTQIPHLLKTILAACVRIPEHHMRVIAPEVGGGFGSKLNVYAEELLSALASIQTGRPVKWIESRAENFLATIHGRDLIGTIELAAKKDGTLIGQRVRIIADIGAYHQLLTAAIPTLTSLMLPGVYKIPALSGEIVEVFTNKTPTDAYRGAGRPEGTYFIERGINMLAQELGMDQVEIRRKNFIGKDEFPYTTSAGVVYDSGDYDGSLDKALANAGWGAVAQLKEEARARNKYLGVGISTYAEICGMGPSAALPAGGWESGTVRVERSGKITVLTGASPHGQGEETSFAQIAAEELGVGIDDVSVLHGDTAQVPFGIGTFGSRATAVGGAALMMSIVKVKDKARRFGAHLLEALPDDIVYEQGRVFVKGHPEKGMALAEIAAAAWNAPNLPPDTEPGLEATSYFEPSNFTYPFGAHVAFVEIDADTGHIDLKRFIAVDDCGRVINPMLVEGQVHGGLAQGIGQAMYEEAVYDESGQLLTGTLMDYCVPRSDQLPSFELDRTVTPTPVNPLGAKGVGEAGTIGSTPAIVNAVVDALQEFGVKHIDMMLRPEKVWRIINGGKQ